jgi:hypothetical protein
VTQGRRRRTSGRQLSLPLRTRRRLRLPPRVVTIDLDATLYDPWACHGYAGDHRSSDGCTHVRQDTLDGVREVCARRAAQPVVLSWRCGPLAVTTAWLREVGLQVAALFLPGAPDDLAEPGHRPGQVGFKEATVRALLCAGVEVVASFDDNAAVLAALHGAGVPDVRLVPHLVDIAPWEWTAGYLGAPRTAATVRTAAATPSSARRRSGAGPRRTVEPPRWERTLGWEDDALNWRDADAFGADLVRPTPTRPAARPLPRARAVHPEPRRRT